MAFCSSRNVASEWSFGLLKLPEEDPESLEASESEDEPPEETSARTRMGRGRRVFGAAVLMHRLEDDSSAECAHLTATDESKGEGVPCDGGMCEAAAEYERRGVRGEGIAVLGYSSNVDGTS